MKQKSLMNLGNEAEEKRGADVAEVNPESLGECAHITCCGSPSMFIAGPAPCLLGILVEDLLTKGKQYRC